MEEKKQPYEGGIGEKKVFQRLALKRRSHWGQKTGKGKQ